MFDIGFWELAVLAIIGLLVVGPERLPAFARETGRWVNKIKRFISHTRRELENEFGETSNYRDKLSDLDSLLKDAPDRDPDYRSKNVEEDSGRSESE